MFGYLGTVVINVSAKFWKGISAFPFLPFFGVWVYFGFLTESSILSNNVLIAI